jgi:putative transposase
LIEAARQLSQRVAVAQACRSLRVARASYYRKINPRQEPLDTDKTALWRAGEKRALKAEEQSEVVELLNSSRFVDQAPREVFAALLDEGKYLCSVSTMYRMLRAAGEVKERRDQIKHPPYSKPQLVARGPNEVWSWDITKLLGPVKWVYFYLYVILDIYSRYVVGWMVASKESGVLAERLIEESLRKQGVEAGQLVIHSDRGGAMKSKPVAMLLADLGETTHPVSS